MRNPRQAWIAGTVIVALILVGAGWFFLVQPKRTQAAELNEQADTLTASNVVLAAKVKTLREQFAKIEDFKAELAALQVRVPVEAAVPELVEQLDTLADDSSVLLESILISEPQEVSGAKSSGSKTMGSVADTIKENAGTDKDGKEPSAEESTAPTSEPTATATEAPKPAASTEKLVAFPTTLTVHGTFNEAGDYLDLLQKELARYFLVSNIAATSVAQSTVLNRDLEDGDVEYVITGSFFVYTDRDFDADPMPEGEYKLPGRSANDNPFTQDLVAGTK